MLCYHQTLTRYGTGSQVLLPGRCNLLERNTTRVFREWWSKMFISLTCSPHASKIGSKPKLKIIHSGKPLEPSVATMGDGPSRVKISGIDVVIPATPIPAIPIQSTAPLPQDEMSIGVCEPTTEEVIELPPEVDLRGVCSPDDDEVESIRRVNEPSLAPCPQRPLRAPQGGISVFNVEAAIREVDKNATRVFGKAILDKVCRTPFDGLPSLKSDFDILYVTILQRGVDVTSLESKVEGLIKQACDFKDLQQNYSGRTSAEEHDTYHMEVQGKLDKASRRLNTEGAHYEAKTAELKHVESRCQELLKELHLLEERQKDLSSQVAASEHLLQEAEQEVIDLQGQIDILNATEVMDAATKASLEKAEAYIKESFEDLKNFQWDPQLAPSFFFFFF
ncbi:hypothetical protein Cgig2_009424 [Carnegiea gigantea]|uniref:Uncharacterized protein n=1 Tax=Carnegiea gigantea TaxID=171969 RepID=A0A9Q1Q6P3_9CARY|nr:hypothetical protein Cgig2_009424 [Carnegiea gigantea]